MRFYKTNGLIYKIAEYKDFDSILSILSPEFGKISVVARGARRPKSRKASHIDIFNFNSFSLNKGKGLDYVSETKNLENFRLFRNKYPFYLFYLAELIDKIEVDENDAEQIYHLIYFSLTIADENDFKKFIAIIELRLLRIVGFEPELNYFLDSEKSFELKDKFYFSYEVPGYRSRGEKETQVVSEVIKCQRFFLNEKLENQKRLTIDENTLNKILSINKVWLQNTLDIKLKTLKFLSL